jgi:predicted nuclease of restriction endonuclease-like (RecB) superfamily
LSWSHIRCLLDKLNDPSDRDWYATEASDNGWSLSVLEPQIATRLRSRVGAAPSNFSGQLPAPDSQLAQTLTKDPYVFDFLDLTESAVEREIEQALMDRLQDTLLDPDQLHLPRPAELEAILTEPFPGHPGSTLADALPDGDTSENTSGG